MIDIRIDSKEGFNVQTENNEFAILETTLDDDLIAEGLARELISKVQQLRKKNDYEVTDHIDIILNTTDLVKDAVNDYTDFIKKETLADTIVFSDQADTEIDINGNETKITISNNR